MMTDNNNKITITINQKLYQVDANSTIIQACEEVGIAIPRFCYHKALNIAGNCRMCLVEVDKMRKPVASCVQKVAENMIIHTENENIKNIRKGIMELLLANHPLDCPVCDQGGECDLQDQAMRYGASFSRFNEEKRVVSDKDMGPLIQTNMTRCIHCTRCIRFVEEVAGTYELGATGRGEDMKVGTYIEKAISSELSGNIIDLCPVGALTSKPYRYQARPWELQKTPSIDIFDGVGSNIVISSKDNKVMRILPNYNDDINEEWISDKVRFSYDALSMQRLETCMIRSKAGELQKVSWNIALSTIREKFLSIQHDKIGAIAGKMQDVESMFVMKKMLNALNNFNHDVREVGSIIKADAARSEYLFNATINGIAKADHCLIINSNPRWEAPVLNSRIRKAIYNNGMDVALLGPRYNLNYSHSYLGNSKWILKQIDDGEHPYCEKLRNADKLLIIIADKVLCDDDAVAISYYAKAISQKYNGLNDGWNGYSVLHHRASTVGGLDISFLPTNKALNTGDMINGKVDLLFLMGEDELDLNQIPDSTTVVYLGHHADKGASRADIILPTAAYSEKDGIFVNTEGKIQQICSAVSPPGDALPDWIAIQKIAKALDIAAIDFNDIIDLRHSLIQEFPIFAALNGEEVKVDSTIWGNKAIGPIVGDKFSVNMSSFYLSDSISRNSKNMAQCELMLR